MQNVMKKGIVWIAAAVISLTVGAFASTTQAHADEQAPIAAADVAITKDFLVPTNVDMIGETFNFSVELKTVNGVDAADTDGGKIANQEIKYTAAGFDGKLHHVDSVSGFLPTADDGNWYKHAGEYVYLISEVGGDNTDVSYNLNSSQYFMHVFVKNNDDGTLSITGVGTWTAVTDQQTGKLVEGKKIDGSIPTKSTETGGVIEHGQMIFNNSYPSQTQELDIKKVVVGDYADKTKGFTFTGFEITTPSITSTAKGSYTAEIWSGTGADAKKVDGSTDVVLTQSGTGSHTYKASNFVLKDGQYLHFFSVENGAQNQLPVGTTYTFTENGTTDFTPSASVQTNGGTVVDVTGTYNAGDSITVNAEKTNNGNVVGQDKENIALVTNTYKTVTPTGILIDNLPWILLVCAGAAGIAVFAVSRRNKKVRVA